ncbi:flagellar biogenesis regulator FlaF [Geotalea daltonii FRC-32]|uniref:Flagellar biogenesis regulator FlaF n=1 Tax=Geotalea daltonii (strain DSM 22248 / JCM 15807 / FRC-32) TaxID=316067 RepID=B9M0H4_GEODF|nr:flagellar biosynthesis regulator FlaF [Geotalea daltonii]ACM19011.1 flagellar biogenesis regulator FlaF [Geotalea daltonii FRC-32]
MLANQIKEYANIQKEALTGRELEASVLTRAAQMLKHCQDNWNAPDREKKLQEALKFNQKIWSFFQAELSVPDNPLPKKLREDILSLSLFVDKRIFEIIAFPESEKLTIVIDINMNIAAGLRTGPGDDI